MGAILVTGGAGYIGSHAAKALYETGREVVVLDSLISGHREAVSGLPLVVADVGDEKAVSEAIRRYQISAVVHFAGFLAVGESVEAPIRYYANNVANTLSLLNVMVREAVLYFVFSSTAAVYGNPSENPIREIHPTEPINSYGETKLVVERALPYYERAYGMHTICLRYFNAAGADAGGQIGEDHRPELHLIPRAIAATMGGAPLEIFGEDYATSDGTCVRDYVHVSDLATAHVAALDGLEAGNPSGIYNLGNSRSSSVLEVVSAVERVTGQTVLQKTSSRRPGDPAVLCASSERARDVLDWRPQYEELDVIVETAWRWHRAHPEGYGSAPGGRLGH